MEDDTIFALATGAGRAAVAVIRISGPAARRALTALASRDFQPRHAHYAAFRNPETGESLDQGLALWFPGPHSATGEDCAEMQLHGGRAVVDGVLSALSAQPGMRPAEPGEFARRAMLGGKMDLSQIEGLADLIDANTAFQRRQALRVAGGALRRRTENWRKTLIEAMALVASDLDFSDEADVGTISREALDRMVRPLVAELDMALRDSPASDRLRDGFLVLIMGPPNAGKSTLLNLLAGRDAAIVSEEAGTTRDLIELQLDMDGLPITLVDTAGLRETSSRVEGLGVARARARAGDADLILWLSPGGREPPPDFGDSGVEILPLASKADLVAVTEGVLAFSCATGAGIEALRAEILGRAGKAMGDGSSALIIRARHRAAIAEARELLRAALEEKSLELAADDLRLAARALARIIGLVDTEELLDVIFSRFCIGK